MGTVNPGSTPGTMSQNAGFEQDPCMIQMPLTVREAPLQQKRHHALLRDLPKETS